jgi:hypothetical protein
MSKRCSVCADSRRPELDRAIIRGVSLRNLEAQHPGLSRGAIDRHRKKCLPMALEKAKELGAEVVSCGMVEDEVKALVVEATNIRKKAAAIGDYRLALLSIREARGCLELVARITGEINSEPAPTQPMNLFTFAPGAEILVNLTGPGPGIIPERRPIDVTPEDGRGDAAAAMPDPEMKD